MKNNSISDYRCHNRKRFHLCVCLGLVAVFWLASFSSGAQEITKILPLGDSITQGGNARPSYRRELWLMLKQNGFNVDFVGSQTGFESTSPPEDQLDFDLDHEGHWGWETNEIADALPAWLESYTVDIALVHLGTNDFDRGESVSDTLNDLSAVLTLLRQSNPDITILLAEIIPMRFKSTRKFNKALKAWASNASTESSKLIIVNQYSGYYSLLYSYDKYHPNSLGEKRIAKRWFDALSEILEPDSETTR